MLTVAHTKEDWNDVSVAELETKGAAASAWTKYCASKVLSEKAAWKYVEENRSTLAYDLTYLLPSWVYGPILTKVRTWPLQPRPDSDHRQVASPDQLVLSMRLLHGHFVHPKTDDATLQSFSGAFSDARDIAHAFIDSFSRPELAGKRIVLASEKHPAIQDLCECSTAFRCKHC